MLLTNNPFRTSFYTPLFGKTKELFNDTMRLNTSSPGLESLQSTQKNPCLTNWKLS